ncbi:MAG: hypothetical protein WBY94_13930 [Polyangiaceae bacterium]
MSAFLVSKRHIDALVYARSLSRYPSANLLPKLSDDELGRRLWRENMASLAGLYGARHGDQIDEGALAAYRYARPAKALSVVGLIKACHCYAYQACEHEAWAKSDARAYCDVLVDMLTHRLPGYDEAAWGLE